MAKLTNVRELGVNAVAEKITYNGAEYVKTEADAKAGDIVRNIRAPFYADVYAGDYFELLAGPSGIYFEDGDDDKRGFDHGGYCYRVKSADFEVFAKVSAPVSAATPASPVAYREVKRVASAGERIRIVKGVSFSDYDNGDEFVVKRVDSDGDAYITDNVGEEECVFLREYVVLEEVVEAVETSAEPIPDTLPEPYVIHNGKVYAKESRKANGGELVIVTDNSALNARDVRPYVPNGTVCEVVDDNPGVAIRGYETAGSFMLEGKYVVLTPVTSVTLGEKEYAIEQRVADVGETVLVLETFCYGKSGDIAKVTESRRGLGDVRTEKHTLMNDDRYVVLVPKEPAKSQPEPAVKQTEIINKKADVGDRIRITAAYGTEGKYANGDVFAVTRIRESDGRVFVAEHDRPIAQEEYEIIPEPVRLTERLTVGDYAKVIALGGGHDYALGDIVEITKDDGKDDCAPYRGKTVASGRVGNWLAEKRVVRATPEEVAAAERVKAEADAKAAEETKWAAIGRKVGEFKVGDIVQTLEDTGGHPIGTIGTLEYDHTWGKLRVRAGGKLYAHHARTLLAPVESLFNSAK